MKKHIIIFALLAISACAKEEVTTREYPRVRTISLSALANRQVHVTGEITYAPKTMIDHGFVLSSLLSNTNVETKDQIRVSLGEKKTKGKFMFIFKETWEPETVYYVRAYTKTEIYTIYGDEVSFMYEKDK